MSGNREFKCLLCGHVHDEAEDGSFDSLDQCPMCGTERKNFQQVEDKKEESKGGKYRCLLCGCIHDEDKDGPISECKECPMCGSDSKNFVPVEGDEETASPAKRVFKCTVCGYVHNEADDGPFEDLDKCPVCGAPPEKFTEITDIADEEKEVEAEDLNLLPEGEDARYKDEIKYMAETGKTIHAAMGPLPRPSDISWDDILIKGGQLARRPLLETEEVNIETVIGKNAKKPMKLAGPVYVSHMSFGALSKEAKISLARGSAMAQTAMCSGEGGVLDEEMEAAHKYIFEYVPNKYSLTDEYLKNSDAIEIKFGQASKPGMGGHLPADKISEEIASIRQKTMGEDIVSPANFEEIVRPEDLKELIDQLRQRSEGRPIGVKLAAGHIEKDLEFALKAGPDFITIDGRGGATGSSPLLLRDSASVPTIYALSRARKYLDSVNSDVDLVITGGLRVSTDFAKALAMGADAVAIATAAMIAVGCRHFRVCNTGHCPVGVATQDEELRKRINLDESSKRVGNFFKVCFDELKAIARITGRKDIGDLDLSDIMTVKKEISDVTDISHC